MFLLLCVLIILLFSIFLGCDSKYFFDLIEGAWGEQPDLETPPQNEDEPAPKRFKTGSPTPSTASSTISSVFFFHIPHLPSILYPLGKSELWLAFLPVDRYHVHNYHHPALIIIFIFPDLLLKILQTSSQEHACPTRTYACLAKHYSNYPICAPKLNLVPAAP